MYSSGQSQINPKQTAHKVGLFSLKLHRRGVSRQDAFTLSVQIEVGEGQDLEQALLALRQRVQKEYGRPWYKSRYGYYENLARRMFNTPKNGNRCTRKGVQRFEGLISQSAG